MFAICNKGVGFRTGCYYGNGVDDRDIYVGENLAAANKIYIIIKALAEQSAVHRVEEDQGDLTMLFNNLTEIENCIKGFTATGFRLGTDVKVNQLTTAYYYIVFWT